MDCNQSGSSVHGNLQARILEWVAIPFSRGSSRPRDWTPVSHIAGWYFTVWATRETQITYIHIMNINKGPSSQSYGFSSSHIQMWELDYKESWVSKNWYFWTIVLEKTPESPLDCKEIKPVNRKGNQSWIFTEKTDAEAETPKLWPPDVKNWLIWKDPDADVKVIVLSSKMWRGKKGTTKNEMIGWHHWLNGHEFEQAPGAGDGQGSLVCCSPWGCRVRHNWAAELSHALLFVHYCYQVKKRL